MGDGDHGFDRHVGIAVQQLGNERFGDPEFLGEFGAAEAGFLHFFHDHFGKAEDRRFRYVVHVVTEFLYFFLVPHVKRQGALPSYNIAVETPAGYEFFRIRHNINLKVNPFQGQAYFSVCGNGLVIRPHTRARFLIVTLQIIPERRGYTENTRELESCIGCNGGLGCDDRIDGLCRRAGAFRQFCEAYVACLDCLAQDVPWRNSVVRLVSALSFPSHECLSLL